MSQCIELGYCNVIVTHAISKCYGKVRVLFFRATTHFTRQVAHFTRSWSSGKMLAFQSRGFVFEPVGMRLFFFKVFRSRRFSLFSALRLFGFKTFFSKFLMSPVLLSIFLIFCNKTNVKNPKGSFFQNFRHYETAVKISHFFSKIFNVDKESPFNFLKF